MSSFSTLNDPRESKDWLCSVSIPPELPGRWDLAELSARFTDFMKASAYLLYFTRDDPGLTPDRRAYLYGRGYAHPSMWDRYAGRHSGVCLAFDIDTLDHDIVAAVGKRGRLLHQGVSYEDMPRTDTEAFHLDAAILEQLGEAATLRKHQETHAGSLYFYKSNDWKAEFEYRWVLLTDEPDVEHFVDVRRSISGVILGDAFPADAKLMIRQILDGSGIKIAQLHYRNGDPTVSGL